MVSIQLISPASEEPFRTIKACHQKARRVSIQLISPASEEYESLGDILLLS